MMKLIIQKNILIAAIVMLGDMLLSYLLHGKFEMSESIMIALFVFLAFFAYDLYKVKNGK